MPAERNKCECSCSGISDCGIFRHTDVEMINDFRVCSAPPIPGAHKTKTRRSAGGAEDFSHARLFI